MSAKIYRRGRLTAMDGYVVPVRYGAYALDTYFNPGHPLHNFLALAKDAISNRDSYLGGTVEKGETLLQALVGECKEEGGLQYNPVIVHEKVLAILALDTDDRFHPCNDRILKFDADNKVFTATKNTDEVYEIGDTFKLRNVFRTKSTCAPEQQPPRKDEQNPEVINPRYEMLLPFEVNARIARPSFQYALEVADKLDILYSIRGLREVEPDWDDLANQWDELHIHPVMTEVVCNRKSSLAEFLREFNQTSEKFGLNTNSLLEGLIMNLQFADMGLHHLLRQKLPNDAEIREILHALQT